MQILFEESVLCYGPLLSFAWTITWLSAAVLTVKYCRGTQQEHLQGLRKRIMMLYAKAMQPQQ